MERLFGTDGLRGEAGRFPLDSATVHRLGLSLADVLRRDHGHEEPALVVGWDGRESGPPIVAALEAGFSAAGGKVRLAGLLPTPGVAFLTRDLGLDAGISVSASHNPWHDNGIKIFSPTGEKLPAEEEEELEAALHVRAEVPTLPCIPSPAEPQLAERYRRYLSDADGNPDLRGLTILVDAANGAASLLAPRLFSALGANVIAECVSPDGRNINAGCGALHPERLVRRVVEEKADLGIALDGDADRLMMVDGDGEIWDGDDLLYLCAKDLASRGELEPRVVVATVMSNFALERALAADGIPLVRTAVGDKHVWAEMVRLGAHVGGEQSGHLIFRPEATTGDGLLAALRVASVVVRSGRRLSEHRALRKLPQILRNVRVSRRIPLAEVPEISDQIRRAEQRLLGRGRVLVRYSGTEPLLRIMVEGEELGEVEEIVAAIAASAESALGAVVPAA